MVTKYHSSEAKARTHDPKTSWEAAEKVSMRFKDAYREGSITPRYATLERKGFIKRDGTTRKGRAGRSQLVMFYQDTGYREVINEKKS